jgi:hypothetical protein
MSRSVLEIVEILARIEGRRVFDMTEILLHEAIRARRAANRRKIRKHELS